MSPSGHEHRFRDVREESGLPPTPERLRQRGESMLRAIAEMMVPLRPTDDRWALDGRTSFAGLLGPNEDLQTGDE
jgi:hypothetical protein